MSQTPITDEAINDSFQTGPHYKVKADAMRALERRLRWLDDNLSVEEVERLFGEEIEHGKLNEAIDKELSK